MQLTHASLLSKSSTKCSEIAGESLLLSLGSRACINQMGPLGRVVTYKVFSQSDHGLLIVIFSIGTNLSV